MENKKEAQEVKSEKPIIQPKTQVKRVAEKPPVCMIPKHGAFRG